MIMRYPGGKAKIATRIVHIIRDRLEESGGAPEYREPFFGGGAVGLGVIRECPGFSRYWLNDFDPAMASLWRGVVGHPGSLRLILGCLEPSVGYFNLYKHLLRKINRPEDLAGYDPVSVAAMKIACHQMSYSGLGTKAGGPIGGANQTGSYDVGCRYNPDRIAGRVRQASGLLSGVALHPEVCTCLDFEEVVTAPGDSVCYLDPPYYKAGPGLYQAAFSHQDHVRLAHVLRDEVRPWLLSYDRHPAIAELYSNWASIEEIPISYSINGAVKSSEWLISNLGGGA